MENLGKYEQALSCYDKSLEINPRYYEALSGKGICLVKLGKYEEALICCNKALEINPDFEEAKKYKTKCLERLKHQKNKKDGTPQDASN